MKHTDTRVQFTKARFHEAMITLLEAKPIKLHYAYSQRDQLTGDFTIDPAIFG